VSPRDEKTHARWRDAPIVDLHTLIGDRPILILAPHPDDETIGCGGLIRQAVRAGNDVFIDILTDGSRSHPHSKVFDRARLSALREEEAVAAVTRLGLGEGALRFWREEDSHLASEDDDTARLTATLRTRIEATRAGAVFVTWTDDPHCDHKAAFRLAVRSLREIVAPPRLYAYPVWSWTIDLERNASEGDVFRLAIGGDLEIKRRALDCHESQLGKIIKDDPEGFCLSAENIALFMQPFETFIAVNGCRACGACPTSLRKNAPNR
jgi:LmbE family N-acetylglucosaminyl deacetylase